MRKKLLLAVTGDFKSMWAVRFVAVVLGRRGLTRFEELFEKSIVSKLMQE
jgi:hypothetical protein